MLQYVSPPSSSVVESSATQLHTSIAPRGLYARMEDSLPRELKLWIADGYRPEDQSLLQTLRAALYQVLQDPNSQPTDCITALSVDPYLGELYRLAAKVSEKMSVGEHTAAACKQVERYLWNHQDRHVCDRRWLSLVLALHDIGKCVGYTSTDQHFFTGIVLKLIAPALPLSPQGFAHLYELCTQNPIGNFIASLTFSTYWRDGGRDLLWGGPVCYDTLYSSMKRYQVALRPNIDLSSSTDTLMQDLRVSAARLNLPLSIILPVQIQYYQMDASSYSFEGSGLPTLERLFEMKPDWSSKDRDGIFLWDTERRRMQFCPVVEGLVRELERRSGLGFA